MVPAPPFTEVALVQVLHEDACSFLRRRMCGTAGHRFASRAASRFQTVRAHLGMVLSPHGKAGNAPPPMRGRLNRRVTLTAAQAWDTSPTADRILDALDSAAPQHPRRMGTPRSPGAPNCRAGHLSSSPAILASDNSPAKAGRTLVRGAAPGVISDEFALADRRLLCSVTTGAGRGRVRGCLGHIPGLPPPCEATSEGACPSGYPMASLPDPGVRSPESSIRCHLPLVPNQKRRSC